jgi:anti-anti-sigma factor
MAMMIEIELRNRELRLRCVGDMVRGSDVGRVADLAGTALVSRVILDFQRVHRVDALGIGVLVRAAVRAKAVGAEMQLLEVPGAVAEAIEICGLARLLNVVPRPPRTIGSCVAWGAPLPGLTCY